MPRTTVISQRSTTLTTFDPIRHDPTAMATMTVNGARRSYVKPGDVITASRRSNARTSGEANVALPRRSYKPTLVP